MNDSEEAVDFLCYRNTHAKRTQNTPLLVVLGLYLKKLNGFELLTFIRNEQSLKAIPVVVLTDTLNEADAQKAEKFGANLFLQKPSEYHELREVVAILKEYWEMVRSKSSLSL